MIDDLESEAAAALPAGAAPGSEGCVRAWAEGDEIEVRCRVGRDGRRHFSHRYGGLRLERATLLRLLCPEGACEQARAVRARWAAHRGHPEPAPARATQAEPLRVADLVRAVHVHAAGHTVEARPARFECLTACPTGAHPPVVLHKGGWDVFDGARYLEGGLQREPRSGTQRPRFEQVAEIARWLRQRAGGASPPA